MQINLTVSLLLIEVQSRLEDSISHHFDPVVLFQDAQVLLNEFVEQFILVERPCLAALGNLVHDRFLFHDDWC